MINLLNLLSTPSGGTTTNQGLPMWVFWVVLIVVCVLMLVMSSRQRKKQQAQMEERMNALKVGDRIKTIGLIVGTIERVNEDGTLLISTGDEEHKNYLTIEKNAVYQTIPDNEPYAEAYQENANEPQAVSVDDEDEGIEVEDIIEEAIADDEDEING